MGFALGDGMTSLPIGGPRGRRAHVAAVALAANAGLALLGAGCLTHERGDDASIAHDAPRSDTALSAADAPSPLSDAPLATDAMLAGDAQCVPGAEVTLAFEPGVPEGIDVTLLGIDPAPEVDGVRFRLDACTGGCPYELTVGHVGDTLASLDVEGLAVSGSMRTDGASYAALSFVDARRCAGCGGTLDVLVGTLSSGLHTSLDVDVATLDCATGCGELRDVTVSAHGESVVVSQGDELLAPPLFAHVSRGYLSPCVVCDCALPDQAASGAVAAVTGIFGASP